MSGFSEISDALESITRTLPATATVNPFLMDDSPSHVTDVVGAESADSAHAVPRLPRLRLVEQDEAADTSAGPAVLPGRGVGAPNGNPMRTGGGNGAPHHGPRAADAPSEEVHDFRLGPVIGGGGMGVVQVAHQAALARDVAIKRVHPDRPDDRCAAALLEEARFMAILDHPNIIPVHILGSDERGLPIVVMKRIRGVPWVELIDNADHPEWTRCKGDRLGLHLELFRQLCNAVEFAHSRGVLHCDIKPDNVMVGDYGEVYLVDWGVARWLEGSQRSGPWRLTGTPAYMAPEMVEVGAPWGPHTDVYLLGATLHHALTGSPRHLGETVGAAVLEALHNEPASYGPEVPRELGAVCNRACASDPAERFESVGALREAIEDYVRHRGAIELVAAAETSLAELEQACDAAQARRDREPAATEEHRSDVLDPEDLDVAVHRCFSEAQFGFTQALRVWPDYTRAQHGRLRAIEAMFDHQLATRNLHAAAALLAELPSASEQRREALQRLEAETRDRVWSSRRLQAIEHEFDLSVSQRQRSLMFLSGTAYLLVTLVASGLLRALDLVNAGFQVLVATPALLLAGGLACGWIWRRSILATTINRRLGFTILTLGVAILANRALAFAQGATIDHALLGDGLLVSVVAAVAGASIRTLYVVPAIVFGTLTTIGTFHPSYALHALALSLLLSVVIVSSASRFLAGTRWEHVLHTPLDRARPRR